MDTELDGPIHVVVQLIGIEKQLEDGKCEEYYPVWQILPTFQIQNFSRYANDITPRDVGN